MLHQVGTCQAVHGSNFSAHTLTFAFRREPFVRKCAFDVGDYGLGYCTFPLSLGCDCLGHIKCGRGTVGLLQLHQRCSSRMWSFVWSPTCILHACMHHFNRCHQCCTMRVLAVHVQIL